MDVDLNGLTVHAHVMGAGCSEAHVAVEWEGHLFVGDLVANKGHSWLELGLVDEWSKRIEELQALKPKWVHPGRGETGGADLLDKQIMYLRDVKSIVASAKDADDAKAKVLAKYPGYDWEVFLEMGIPAVWEKLHP